MLKFSKKILLIYYFVQITICCNSGSNSDLRRMDKKEPFCSNTHSSLNNKYNDIDPNTPDIQYAARILMQMHYRIINEKLKNRKNINITLPNINSYIKIPRKQSLNNKYNVNNNTVFNITNIINPNYSTNYRYNYIYNYRYNTRYNSNYNYYNNYYNNNRINNNSKKRGHYLCKNKSNSKKKIVKRLKNNFSFTTCIICKESIERHTVQSHYLNKHEDDISNDNAICLEHECSKHKNFGPTFGIKDHLKEEHGISRPMKWTHYALLSKETFN